MTLFVKAVKKADEVRTKLGLNIFQPVNVFDICATLGVDVRFVDINMEGMYIVQNNGKHPTILLSNQRPLPRRFFSCAHELGHHVFKHGTRLDALTDHNNPHASDDEEELLVDTFAGAFLMPGAGIQAELSKRNWNPNQISPIQFYTLSSIFGTGYETLNVHCKINKIITDATSKTLSQHTPAKILKSIFGIVENNSHFKIIDDYYTSTVIDLEVSNFIILPTNIKIEGDHLQEYKDSTLGKGYLAIKPGIVHATDINKNVGYFVRIQNAGYVGLAENRHLETKD